MNAAENRWLKIAGGACALGLAAFCVSSYFDYQERSELKKRKTAFAQVVYLAVLAAEAELAKKGVIAVSASPRPACDLDTCADVKKFSVSPDGTMVAVLSGKQEPGLEGRKLVLVPKVAGSAVSWTCRTDAPETLVPLPQDKLPGFVVDNVGFCGPLLN